MVEIKERKYSLHYIPSYKKTPIINTQLLTRQRESRAKLHAGTNKHGNIQPVAMTDQFLNAGVKIITSTENN